MYGIHSWGITHKAELGLTRAQRGDNANVETLLGCKGLMGVEIKSNPVKSGDGSGDLIPSGRA
jgi:hypothetical protein